MKQAVKMDMKVLKRFQLHFDEKSLSYFDKKAAGVEQLFLYLKLFYLYFLFILFIYTFYLNLTMAGGSVRQ